MWMSFICPSKSILPPISRSLAAGWIPLMRSISQTSRGGKVVIALTAASGNAEVWLVP